MIYEFDKLIAPGDPHLNTVTPSSRVDNYEQTCLRKFEHLCEQCSLLNAALVIPGDLFHRPNQTDEFKTKLTQTIKRWKTTVFCIPGNHDVQFYNMNMLAKSSLGNMFVNGHIIRLDQVGIKTKTGKTWKLVAHHIDQDCPPLDDSSILVSHRAFGIDMNDGLFYSLPWMKECPARVAILGHDHIRYPLVDQGGTIVVRPGGMCRSTSKTEDKIRDPKFALIDLVKLENLGLNKRSSDPRTSITYEVIPHAPMDQVYSFEPAKLSPDQSFDKLHEFIDYLKEARVELTPYEILAQMELDDTVRTMVTYYLENAGLLPTVEGTH